MCLSIFLILHGFIGEYLITTNTLDCRDAPKSKGTIGPSRAGGITNEQGTSFCKNLNFPTCIHQKVFPKFLKETKIVETCTIGILPTFSRNCFSHQFLRIVCERAQFAGFFFFFLLLYYLPPPRKKFSWNNCYPHRAQRSCFVLFLWACSTRIYGLPTSVSGDCSSSFTSGSTCVPKCANGFILIGPPVTYTCQFGGKWCVSSPIYSRKRN